MPSNPYFLVQPDGDRSFRANPCNSLLVSFHDSRMSLMDLINGDIGTAQVQQINRVALANDLRQELLVR